MSRTRVTRRCTVLAITLTFASLAARASAQDLPPPSTGAPGDNANAPGPQPGATADDTKATEEKKDSKRGLEWLYLNADAGFSYINMASFSTSTLSVQNTASQGPTFGVAAGIRLFILSLGVRANLNTLSSFNLWQLDGELGFHIPLGHWEPYIGFHGGYCFVGSLEDGVSGSSNVSITGGDAGMQVGLDYYFNHFVSLGLDVSGNVLFLSGASQVPAAANVVPGAAQSGDSIGFGVSPSLRLGFHL
jgi:hypothetical protein